MSGGGKRPTRVDASAGRGVQVGDYNTQNNYISVAPGVTAGETTNRDIYDHVPNSDAEINYVVGHRPPAWEYLLYVGVLQVGLREANREGKSRPSPQLAFSNTEAALDYTRVLFEELESINREIAACFDQALLSKAMGEPGRPGEFRLIYDVAHKLVVAYEKLIGWRDAARAAYVSREARQLYYVISGFADRRMRDIEEYVRRFVAELNDVVRRASLGKLHHTAVLTLVCETSTNEDLLEELAREAKRVQLWVNRHPGE